MHYRFLGLTISLPFSYLVRFRFYVYLLLLLYVVLSFILTVIKETSYDMQPLPQHPPIMSVKEWKRNLVQNESTRVPCRNMIDEMSIFGY